MPLTDRMIDDATVDRIIALREALFSAKPYRYDLQSTYETYAEEFAYELAHDLRALRAAVRAMPEPREWHAGLHWCPACKGGTTSMHTTPVTHAPDCPWAVARALAGEEGAE